MASFEIEIRRIVAVVIVGAVAHAPHAALGQIHRYEIDFYY
jgi:hypothetical protein